ncbi:MAG: TonB-dependent receptor [Pseudomonadota bacterium]
MTSLYKVSLGVALASFGLISGQALAQQNESNEEGADDLEEIVVTGSRIRRTNAQSAIPLQIFGLDELEEIGTTDLAEAMTQLPGVGNAISPSNSNTSIQNAGLSTISLRRLGDDRTLVLINGKRAVSNSGNNDRVSLSTLPVGFIERTEITTGGASAIYGSDAIAGVANFLLEDDFEGFEFDMRTSTPEADGGDEPRLNFRAGQQYADDRGYFLFAASWRDEEQIVADASRPLTVRAIEFDNPNTSDSNSFADEINTPGCDPLNDNRHCFLPSFSTNLPGGVFEGGDAWFSNGQWFNDQSLQPPDRSGTQDFFADFDGFDFRPGRTLEGSREILNVAATTSFEFTPDVEGSVTLMYSDIDSQTSSGSETLNDDDAFGILDVFEVGNIASDHPFIPPEVEETRGGSVSFDRRLIELGIQSRISNRKTWRMIADLQGSFDNGHNWEIYTTYGKFEQEQRNPNEVNFRNAQFALDIEDDGNGGFQCVDAAARAAGCVPLNIFGEGTISAAAADYIRYNGFATQERDQISAGASINGDLFEIPMGDVKFAAGVEYRREEQSTEGDPDGDIVGGIDGDPATDDVFITSLATFPSITADYQVFEGYGEIDVPLIRDALNLQAAVRVGDYDTVGTITSFNVGAVWTPLEDISFRAQYSRSQRAPNLTELFSPSRPDSDDLRDPCDGLEADGTGIQEPDGTGSENADLAVVTANCQAEPGIIAFFDDPDNAGAAFEFDSSVQGPNAGNLDLREETADTFTAGFVLRPRFLDNFTLIADYYRIEIEDAITSVSTQDTVDLCYSAVDFPNNRFCEVVTRNPFNGEVVEVINFQENLNEELVSGVDVTLAYVAEFDFIPGEFDFDFRYSQYFDQEVTFAGIGGVLLTTSPLGEIGDGEEEWRARLRYSVGGFRLTYTTVYASGGVDDLENDPNPGDDRYFEVGGETYHNVFLSYRFGDDNRYRVYGGVNNIYDNYGPFLPDGLDTGGTRNITNDLNDVVGREFFAGLRVRF